MPRVPSGSTKVLGVVVVVTLRSSVASTSLGLAGNMAVVLGRAANAHWRQKRRATDMPMTLSTFDALVDAFFDKCKEVMKTKGADYTKKSDNKLSNFERQAQRRGMSPLNVIAIFQDKHRDAIDSYIENGELESSESLEMRFVDDINYDLLMIAQAIAEGYAPTEDWLKAALVGAPLSLAEAEEIATPTVPDTSPIRVLDFKETSQACCNPDGEDCCDGKDED